MLKTLTLKLDDKYHRELEILAGRYGTTKRYVVERLIAFALETNLFDEILKSKEEVREVRAISEAKREEEKRKYYDKALEEAERYKRSLLERRLGWVRIF